MNFCQHVIHTEAELTPDQGVLSLASMTITSDAVQAAARILDNARGAALEVTERAERAANERVAALQRQTLEQGQAMMASLQQLRDSLFERAEDTVIELAHALFLRLVGELSERERSALLLRQMVAAAPQRLAEPVLRMHPADVAALDPASLPRDWDLKADPAMARQCCRLEALSGEWCFDFDAAVLALEKGLDDARASQPSAPSDDGQLFEAGQSSEEGQAH